MADFANEGGHWYLPNGDAYYTVVGANGIERPATLRDARKVGAVPGATGVIKMAAAPGLQRWILRQLALAMATLPRLDGESWDAFIDRAEADSRKEGKAAADRGTAIHAEIEKHYRGDLVNPDLRLWVDAVRIEIAECCSVQKWHAERSFASPVGYGGKTDLHSGEWVIDVKGKESIEPHNLTLWDEHFMQLAAYREGLLIPGARCGILFVNRTTPEAVLIEAKEAELARGWEMFLALLKYWKAKNKYAP